MIAARVAGKGALHLGIVSDGTYLEVLQRLPDHRHHLDQNVQGTERTTTSITRQASAVSPTMITPPRAQR